MRMRNILILFVLLFFISCVKEDFLSSSQYQLQFSTDTIFFDTIFTKKGSITRFCKLYNPHKGTIVVDEICVGNQQNVQFFINVNGNSASQIKNLRIDGGDSVFVFVQAKLQENNVDTAISHTDSIVLKYNGIRQKIVLQAWGQNVQNIKGVLSQNTTFTSQIPYVVYDSLVVPYGVTLSIEAGAKLYMHYKANIIVHGTLQIHGTKDKPVLITNDRLEQTYQQLPGQWGSIVFSPTSSNNVISFANIKNGTNGLKITGSSQALVDVSVQACDIHTMSSHIIYAQYAQLNIGNSVLYNSNYYVLAIQGGDCTITHTTISNYGTIGFRNTTSSVIVCNYNLENQNEMILNKFQCLNSIIVGQTTNEISILSLDKNSQLPCAFKYSLIKDTYSGKDTVYYSNIVPFDVNKKLFKSLSMSDFMLDTLSQAKDIGFLPYSQMYETDKAGKSRIIDNKPDAGAYEYFYETK